MFSLTSRYNFPKIFKIASQLNSRFLGPISEGVKSENMLNFLMDQMPGFNWKLTVRRDQDQLQDQDRIKWFLEKTQMKLDWQRNIFWNNQWKNKWKKRERTYQRWSEDNEKYDVRWRMSVRWKNKTSSRETLVSSSRRFQQGDRLKMVEI